METKIKALAEKLQSIDFDQLPISDYNKAYISRLKPALHYYMKIFAVCLQKGIYATGLQPSEITLVDYGGGHGFLSMLAKEMKFGTVIYIDINAYSVQTITLLKERLTVGPDIILHGNSDILKDYCREKQLKPQLLIATDLIEHVYDLSVFFSDLIHINHAMHMLFTTASTPFNPFVKRRLHKTMTACETGMLEQPNYYTRRSEYIRKQFPRLSADEVKTWSECTRGLIFSDIRKALTENIRPTPNDKYNTCDPETGNWTERILPIKTYRQLLSPYDYRLKVEKGFYNIYRNDKLKTVLSRILNGIISFSGKVGFGLAPFIILLCSPKSVPGGRRK